MGGLNVGPKVDTVICETEIAAPPERVFVALTDPRQLFVWWGREPSVELSVFEMDARPGGRWRFRCRPVAGADRGAVGEQLRCNRMEEFEAHGEVLECVPPRLLVWSWIANWHEHPIEPTLVRWELSPTSRGTHVRVTHSGLAHEPIACRDYKQGWDGVLRLLQSFIEQR